MNSKGFSLIEIVISISLISIMSISVGRFASTTIKTVKDIDNSLMVEDSVNYTCEFIREYIEVMEKISHMDGEKAIMENGDVGYRFNSISFTNENYFEDKIAHFSLVKKKRIDADEQVFYGMTFRRKDIEGYRDMSPKGGSEILEYMVNDIIAVPLPDGVHFSEADGLKMIFIWKGRTGIYEFERSFYFKNKKHK